MDDLPTLAADLIELIRARELETASARLHAVRRRTLDEQTRDRRRSVHEVTLALVEAKKQRTRLMREFEALPETERHFARFEFDAMCRILFDEEIAWLTTRKRQLSAPGGA
jgi:hypothetical protein